MDIRDFRTEHWLYDLTWVKLSHILPVASTMYIPIYEFALHEAPIWKRITRISIRIFPNGNLQILQALSKGLDRACNNSLKPTHLRRAA